jgi:hypothetical protein
MAADWWDIYGLPQLQPEDRRCWDCHDAVRLESLSPDGVRCIECWRGRTEMGSERRHQQRRRYARTAPQKVKAT